LYTVPYSRTWCSCTLSVYIAPTSKYAFSPRLSVLDDGPPGSGLSFFSTPRDPSARSLSRRPEFFSKLFEDRSLVRQGSRAWVIPSFSPPQRTVPFVSPPLWSILVPCEVGHKVGPSASLVPPRSAVFWPSLFRARRSVFSFPRAWMCCSDVFSQGRRCLAFFLLACRFSPPPPLAPSRLALPAWSVRRTDRISCHLTKTPHSVAVFLLPISSRSPPPPPELSDVFSLHNRCLSHDRRVTH